MVERGAFAAVREDKEMGEDNSRQKIAEKKLPPEEGPPSSSSTDALLSRLAPALSEWRSKEDVLRFAEEENRYW